MLKIRSSLLTLVIASVITLPPPSPLPEDAAEVKWETAVDQALASIRPAGDGISVPKP